MNPLISQVTAKTFVGDFGQAIESFALTLNGTVPAVTAADFRIEGAQKDISGKVPPCGVLDVEIEQNALTLLVDPFLFRTNFRVVGTGAAAELSFIKSDITSTITRTADDFEAHNENGVLFRLFRPTGTEPRPLVLFLHGGGESGNDNFFQMVGSLGAACLAERWPDAYIMAPQAPGTLMTPEEFNRLMKSANPFDMRVGKQPESVKGARGWNRDYLMRVCQVIRGMIADGLVDRRRVYVTGLSMGGGGTVRILSVDPDLFAAAAPVCPSMNGETFQILQNVRRTALWISAAYIDHQPGRHAYLFQAYQKLLEDGYTEVHMTIFTPEELAAYGIGCSSDLTMAELLGENHNCWALTYHNEHGILDWLISVVKED